VLILGRIDDGGGYKGHRELISAWPRVVASVPSARLIIAGDGPGAPVVSNWVRESTARDRIQMLGFVDEAEIDGLFRRASIFAMPSRGEGFGFVYIQAMARGVPVLASVHDAAGEINMHGQTGYNVNLDEPEDLPTRLIAMLRDPEELSRLGEGAQARWHEHFRFGVFRDRFRSQLRDLIAR
jgi:phosphatidylinositol alpha-1,6-mannosyltransferase